MDGSPIWGLLAMTGRGHSVGRAKCPDSRYYGTDVCVRPRRAFRQHGGGANMKELHYRLQREVSGEIQWVFVLHPFAASHELQAAVPNMGRTTRRQEQT